MREGPGAKKGQKSSPTSAASLTIASNDLEIGVFLFDVFDHIDLEDGVSLGRILGQEEVLYHDMAITPSVPPQLML